MFRFTKTFAAISITALAALAVCATGSPVHAQTARTTVASGVTPQGTYVVLWGDSLFGIANKLGVKLGALLDVNHFVITSVIHPGDTLQVPGIAGLPATAPAAGTNVPAATYLVQSGDYLISIAIRNGVTLSALLSANKLVVTSVIHPGDTLIIPGATLPVAAVPATVAPQPQVTNQPATTYLVVSGDSLIGIAIRSKVTLSALLRANKLIVTSVIHPGDSLIIPATTIPVPAAPAVVVTQPAGTTTTTTPPAAAPGSSVPTSIATVLTYLQAQIGKPYLFNSAGPNSFDCSGLTLAAYAKIGVALPHQSLLQSKYGTAVDWTTQPILPGDLVFTYSSSNPSVIGHVGVAIDSKTWIHSSGSGTPVRIGPLPNAERIRAVRRLVQR